VNNDFFSDENREAMDFINRRRVVEHAIRFYMGLIGRPSKADRKAQERADRMFNLFSGI
jgi:hypothetical protein